MLAPPPGFRSTPVDDDEGGRRKCSTCRIWPNTVDGRCGCNSPRPPIDRDEADAYDPWPDLLDGYIWRDPPPDCVPISPATLHQIHADFRAAINLQNEALIALAKERTCAIWWTRDDGPMMPLSLVPGPDEQVPQTPTLEQAEAAITETRTDTHGWPLSLPDDRIAVGDNEPLPPPPPPPDVLGVLYSDKRNVLAGEPACGKTWIAMECAAHLVYLGQRIVWLDAEDSAATFSERMARLGHRDLTRSVMVRRVNHADWIDADALDRAAVSAWLANSPAGAGHLFIDSGTATESGISADDYAAWMTRHAVHVGMTTIEHVAKDPEQRYGPLGSTRKNAAATGIVALIEGAAWTPTESAAVNLRVVKDRPGGTTRQKGALYATVYGDPHVDGSVTINVRPPVEESAAYLPLIISAVEDEPAIGSRDLRYRVAEAAKIAGLRSDWQTVNAEITEAVKKGHIVKTKGKGNRVHHHPADPA